MMDNEKFDITSISEETTETDNDLDMITGNEEDIDIADDYKIMLPKKAKPIKKSGFKALGNIVKVIAFLVAFAVIAIHVLAAYVLFAFRPLYISVCVAIVTFGFVLSLIILFLIYALGHSINQNNEILALLRRGDKDK